MQIPSEWKDSHGLSVLKTFTKFYVYKRLSKNHLKIQCCKSQVSGKILMGCLSWRHSQNFMFINVYQKGNFIQCCKSWWAERVCGLSWRHAQNFMFIKVYQKTILKYSVANPKWVERFSWLVLRTFTKFYLYKNVQKDTMIYN